jgi:zinc transport system substrate-binding protein
MRNTIIAIMLIVILTAGCITTDQNQEDDQRINIVTTIAPMQEFAEKVGGDKVRVTALVPPGGDPHTYEPAPNQLVELSKAQLYVEVGSGIDFEISWLDKLKSINNKMIFVNASENIALINSTDPDEEGMDPHTWTSIRNAKIMVRNIYEGLAEIDPANKEYYAKNRDDYLVELTALDMSLSETLKEKENKKFIIYHPSLGYFAQDYGLEQIAIERSGKEPTPQWMQRIIDTAKAENITVVLVSPEFSTASADMIASEIHGRVVQINPLRKDYARGIRETAAAINNN